MNNTSNFIIYKTSKGDVKIEVFLHNETIWLTQKKMADLFGVSIPTINEHIKNIFKSNELREETVVRKFLITANDNKQYNTKFYNLDVIISVGYRVNSHRATQFRIWATNVLKEYIIKGFSMDDERLKNPKNVFGKDYFDEQLERIRDIRTSERRFYQKITDIYSQCSADYDPNSKITEEFFATVQNKLHWAITKMTAAEILFKRANAKKKYGLNFLEEFTTR